jgi:hypothetical protein
LHSRDIRTASLLTTVSVSGKRDSEGQRQLAQNRLQAGKGLHGDRNADVGARQLRPFLKSQGNLAVRKSAWWGWKDSNLQPGGYELEGLELSWKDSNLQPDSKYLPGMQFCRNESPARVSKGASESPSMSRNVVRALNI